MTKPSISFWVISVVALLWNLMGVSQYIQQAYNTESFRAMYTGNVSNLVMTHNKNTNQLIII